MPGPYNVAISRSARYDVAPDELWSRLQRFDDFRDRWSWLRELHVENDAIESGNRFSFVARSRLPVTLRAQGRFVEVEPSALVRAEVTGDLNGPASMTLEPDGEGTLLKLEWDVGVMHTQLRTLMRFARPVVQRSHDWAVGIALRWLATELEKKE